MDQQVDEQKVRLAVNEQLSLCCVMNGMPNQLVRLTYSQTASHVHIRRTQKKKTKRLLVTQSGLSSKKS